MLEQPGADLVALLGPFNGKVVNTAAISRELGVSRRTGRSRLRALERDGRLRLLPFYGGGGRSLLYLPQSFTGACVDAVITRMLEILPESRFFWWKTGRTRRIDLLAVTGREQIGFRFCSEPMVRNGDWWPLRIAYRRGLIQRGFLLYTGTQSFVVAAVVQGLPLGAFFKELESWILIRRSKEEAREAQTRLNAALR